MSERPTREEFATMMQQGTIGDQFRTWVLDMVASKFDIWAKRGCHVVWDENDLGMFDAWLFSYAQGWLDEMKKAGHEVILPDVQVRLIERMAYWKAVPRRMLTAYRGEVKKGTEEMEPSHEKTAQGAKSKPGRPRKDSERELIKAARAEHLSWKEVANKLNARTGQRKSPEAYRGLLKSGSMNAKHTGKNGQK